MLILLDK
jgi:hypothetical protein